jgi:aspartyl-tRNA(Asn)/glutamyl-tRNA(Gln) amidotransferase subunit A
MQEGAMGSIVEKARLGIAKVEALGERARGIFTEFDPARIIASAEDAERLCSAAIAPLPLGGLLVSVKDLYDEKGIRTTAASRLLADREPAAQDCDVIARIKAAGAVPFGRTALSEFAYSGVGLNPHFGTPGNALDETAVPGGSTSGGAVSVALGLCDIALGTDTGGSVRIPAAANGIFGFKPTQASVPLTGVHPLSQTFDSAGPLARDLPTTITAYEVMRGERRPEPRKPAGHALRLAIPVGALTDELDENVAADWRETLAALKTMGHELVEFDAEFLGQAGRMIGMIIATEAFAQYGPHAARLESIGDPNVLRRMRVAEMLSKTDVETAYRARQGLVTRFADAMAPFDALIAPTLRIKPPKIADVEASFDKWNAAMLRNTSMINAADGCALTMPLRSKTGPFPASLMIANARGRDWDVLDAAELLERGFRTL